MTDKIIVTDKSASVFLEQADKDYLIARLLFGCGNCFHSPSAYHSQQCLEKYIKTYTVQESNTYLKTHDLEKLRQMAERYNQYFSESEAKKQLSKFDYFDQVARYGAEASFDPHRYKDDNLELAGFLCFSSEHIKILDKLVYDIRNLLDFNKIRCRDNLKDILEDKKEGIFTLTWKLPIPVKTILTIKNDCYKQ